MARPALSTPARLVRVPLLLLALTSACDEGGGGGGTTVPIGDPSDGGIQVSDASTVATAPTVIATSPATNAKGVEEDAVLVFQFSEPMDKAATEAAYVSDALPVASVTFQWNDAADTLTVIPNDPLPYAKGDASVEALSFTARISTAARSKTGEALAAESVISFSTLRRIVVQAPVVSSLTGRSSSNGASSTAFFNVGDFATNASVSGFATFSLAGVPDGVPIAYAGFRSQESGLSGTPDTDLGALTAQHVFFTTLDASAYAAELLSATPNQVIVERSKSAPYTRVADLAAFVQDDLANRAARNDRTQARFRYATATDSDGVADAVSISLPSVSLEIHYFAE